MKIIMWQHVHVHAAQPQSLQLRLQTEQTSTSEATHPFADNAAPADDAGAEPRVRLDDGALEQCRPLDARAVFDHDIRTDRHVRTNPTVLAYLCCRMLRKKNVQYRVT